ncbi:MAG: UbiA family prenyltransferase [Polyangiales bacterium]
MRAVAARALRTRQWAHFAVLPLAGLHALSAREAPRIALAIVAASASLAYAYGLNACTDRGSDASADKNPLVGLSETPSSVRVMVAISAVLALVATIPLGLDAIKLMAASLIAGTAYSAGPRLKMWPVLGLMFNTAIFAPLLGLLRFPSAVIFAVFVALLVQSQLLHEAADAAEDAIAGARTTARMLGASSTRAVVVLVVIPTVVVVLRSAPNLTVTLAAAVTMGASTIAALVEADPAAARTFHRRVSIAGGALLFLAELFAS